MAIMRLMDLLTLALVRLFSHHIYCRTELIPEIQNDFGTAGVNITQKGDFTKAPYAYTLTPLASVEKVVKRGAGRGKI